MDQFVIYPHYLSILSDTAFDLGPIWVRCYPGNQQPLVYDKPASMTRWLSSHNTRE